MSLVIENLQAFYNASQALFGVSFSVDKGQVVALIGRNGMGKTTTISAVMGLLAKTTGSVQFAGNEISDLPPYKIARLGIGLVPEGRQIFPNLTVAENLIANARSGAWNAARIYQMFPALLQRKKSMGNLLSGGEQQMLAIGRALMTNPELLILDEATEGLAPLVRDEIWRCISDITQQGMSILVVDKNLKDVLRVADKAVVIKKGKIIFDSLVTDHNKAQLQDEITQLIKV